MISSLFVQSLSARRLTARSFIRIHLLNLQDGSPYYPIPSNPITWELPCRAYLMANDAMAITGSRVMVYTSYLDEDIPSQGVVWRVAVWDWKTGDSASLPRLDQSYSTNPAQVLDLKSTDRSALVGWNTQINFLDEFRVVILVNKSDVTELFVFNTLVPQDHPGNLRRLELPQQFHHTAAKICVDRDRSLGTQPLIPDPA